MTWGADSSTPADSSTATADGGTAPVTPSAFGQAILTAYSQTGYQGAQSAYIEQSACIVFAEYLDIAGANFIPTDVQYRIDDDLSGQIILGYTEIEAQEQNTIIVSSAQNSLISFTRPWETHVVTLQITDGFGDVYLAQVKFELVRTLGVES